MKMAYRLAHLAVSRSAWYQGARTAWACGDHEWAREAYRDAESLQRRIDALKRVLSPEVVAEAREITDATI